MDKFRYDDSTNTLYVLNSDQDAYVFYSKNNETEQEAINNYINDEAGELDEIFSNGYR